MTPAQIMDAQYVFLKRLEGHGVAIHFYGVTDIDRRWTRIRAAIVGAKLESTLFGRKVDASFETYRQAFERASKQPLIEANQ